MTALIIIIVIILIGVVAIKATIANDESKSESRKANTERKKQEIEAYLEEQKKKEETPQTESEPDEEEPSDFDGLDYEEKMKALAKQCENLLFETVSSLEMTRAEKVQLIPEILSSIEQHPDETKILKAVVRKLFKTLIDRTPDLMKRVDYQERFDEEKEELRSRDYVVIDSQWNQFLDDFDELKEDIDNLLKGKEPVKEEIEDDETQYRVLNFAVKGLFFRTKEDQDAACTLHVGDPLHMEPEEGNEKDPYAMKVTMMDGHHIGYVDAKYSNYVKSNLYRLVKFKVSKIDDEHEPPYIYANAYYEKE